MVKRRGEVFFIYIKGHLDYRIGNFLKQKQKGSHILDRNGNSTNTLAPRKYF